MTAGEGEAAASDTPAVTASARARPLLAVARSLLPAVRAAASLVIGPQDLAEVIALLP